MKLHQIFVLITFAVAAVIIWHLQIQLELETDVTPAAIPATPVASEQPQTRPTQKPAMLLPTPMILDARLAEETSPGIREFKSAAFPTRRCRMKHIEITDQKGNKKTVEVCGSVKFQEANIYATHSSQKLEQLAYDDPRAAQMLAIRNRTNPTIALQHAVRATALGKNDALPLIWYMKEVKPLPAFGRQTRLEQYKMNYVLSGVARALDSHDSVVNHDYWHQQVTQMSDNAQVIKRLDQHVHNMLREIARIQQEVGIVPTNAE